MKKFIFSLFAVFMSISVALAVVNINTASKAELQSLKGIGAKKADSIIKYRTQNGQFKTIEEIKKVNGIGDAIYGDIKKDISIAGKTEIEIKEKKVSKSTPAKAKAAPKK